MAKILVDHFRQSSFDMGIWDSAVTDGGDLSVVNSPTYAGAYGMRAHLDNVTAIYLQKALTSRGAGTTTQMGWHMNISAATKAAMAANDNLYVGSLRDAVDAIVAVRVSHHAGIVQWALYRYADGGRNWFASGVEVVADTWHLVEIGNYFAANPGDDDGWSKLWLNETPIVEKIGLNNDLGAINRVRFGVHWLTGGEGANSYVYWDEVVIADSYIGPMVINRPLMNSPVLGRALLTGGLTK